MATSTTPQPYTADRPENSTTSVDAREKQKPGSCRQRGDLNGVAEVLQTHDEASGVDGFGPLVEVVRAEIAIELTARRWSGSRRRARRAPFWRRGGRAGGGIGPGDSWPSCGRRPRRIARGWS